MSSAALTLTGTEFGEWSSTPSTAANLHHTLVDDAFPPGDETDYVNCGGDGGGTESYYLSAGPAGISRVLNIHIDLLMYGQFVSETPGMRVEIWVQDVLAGSRQIGADSGGTWFTAGINIQVDIPPAKWYAGTRVVRFIPLDGSGGFGPIPTDPDS